MKNSECHLLLIGVGGVGSEILKNLVLTGYKKITILDMDTIDKSNLNRQFLFQKDSIGEAKVHAAKKYIQENFSHFQVTIEAIQNSVFSSKISATWIRSFDTVINALDNIKARLHVNDLCLKGGITLIESGTHGYIGQTSVIIPEKSSCYACWASESSSFIPTCTLRSTPTEYHHNVAWAKRLFESLFIQDNEASFYSLKEKMTILDNESLDKTYEIIFSERVKEVLDPIILKTDAADEVENPDKFEIETADHLILCFNKSFGALKKSMSSSIRAWDKDDDNSLSFVHAAANIRNLIFGIKQKTKWETKRIAGRIIPAIATSNAIIAGLVCLQLFNIQMENSEPIGYINLQEYFLESPTFIKRRALPKRNIKCVACEPRKHIRLAISFQELTMLSFVDKILLGELKLNDPSLIDGDRIFMLEGDAIDEDWRSQNNIKLSTMFSQAKQIFVVKDESLEKDLQLEITNSSN